MTEAARTFETSVDNYFTRQYIPEDNSELHTRRRENLKSHIKIQVCNEVMFSWNQTAKYYSEEICSFKGETNMKRRK
jgi:hypothetical protein